MVGPPRRAWAGIEDSGDWNDGTSVEDHRMGITKLTKQNAKWQFNYSVSLQDVDNSFHNRISQFACWCSLRPQVKFDQRLGEPQEYAGNWIRYPWTYADGCRPLPTKGESWRKAFHWSNMQSLYSIFVNQALKEVWHREANKHIVWCNGTGLDGNQAWRMELPSTKD